MRIDVAVFLVEFLFQFSKLNFILPQQCPLIHVLIDPRLILDLLGPRRELECGYALAKPLSSW